MRRVGFGRRCGRADFTGDPLDGLVNLFDLGIVLAVGFLVAALGAVQLHPGMANSSKDSVRRSTKRTQPQMVRPQSQRQVKGKGRPVGTIYKLENGQLVYVRR